MSELLQIEDGSSWPNPYYSYDKTFAWKLRQGIELTQHERNCMATIIDSYNSLVNIPQFSAKLPMIRRALTTNRSK